MCSKVFDGMGFVWRFKIVKRVDESPIGIKDVVPFGRSRKKENGKPVVKRGGLGSVGRGKMIWRIFLEQGGIDAYTGQPLQLESMDLEHVVGFENDDDGIPTDEDYKNREHELNQVLTSSAVNQTKKDMNMSEVSGLVSVGIL